jgi:hypothetical protein
VADHPVKVPEDLVRRLREEASSIPASQVGTVYDRQNSWIEYLADRAAQWGADQELEACIDVLGSQSAWDVLAECTGWKEFRDESEDILRAARRPKPPTLAEQGMEALSRCLLFSSDELRALRAALNRLAELEAQQ